MYQLKNVAIALGLIVIVILALDFQVSLETAGACEKPLTYTVGTFDRRFGISQKYFLSALLEAEAIWEKPSGLDLFAYNPKESELSVNLIYDYRQEATSILSGLESNLEQKEIAYKTLETRFSGLKSELNVLKAAYSQRVLAFKELNNAYERLVETWNSGNKTSREQFDALEAAGAALEAEVIELNKLEIELNRRVSEINALVAPLNELAGDLNLSVDEYNTIGVSRGETFTEGVYFSDNTGRGIDIYEFGSRRKLVWVLAHELGHALGLDHNTDKVSIMYYLNESDAGVVSATDLALLAALCGKD